MGSGDRHELLQHLYFTYNHSIFQYILLMVSDSEEAKDLTQETFVKAFQALESFRGESSYKTWLFSIARNVTLDFMRKKRPIHFLQHLPGLKRDERPLPIEAVVLGEDTQALYRALHKIKEEYREVIILRKIKEFSTNETCQILGWSEGKMKAKLHRGLASLKKELIKGGYDHEII